MWGSASLLLDGTGDWLTVPDSADWDICASDSDDWTIDFWGKHTYHTGNENYIGQYEDELQWWGMYHLHGSGIRFEIYSLYDGVHFNTGYGGEITDTDWHHIALCKVGEKYAVYLDGQKVNYVQDSRTHNFTGELAIGAHYQAGGYTNFFDGHMDELRTIHTNSFNASPTEGIPATVDMGAYELWDSDGDGIEESIDTEPTVYSNDFSDAATTSGTITDRGEQLLSITDEPDPCGVRIVASPAGGIIPATVSVCGGQSILTLNAGDEAVVTCGSVEINVISGIVEVTFVPIDGSPATTSLAAGNSLTFEAVTFTITAPSTNPDVAVVVVEGEEFSLAPGESLTFNQPPVANAGPDQTAYARGNGMAEVELDGSDSNDPDGDELTYLWTWTIDGNIYEANGVNPTIELPVGEHTIELIVNDGIGDSEPDYVNMNVVAGLEADMWMRPRVINRSNRMLRLMVLVRLPEGINKNQIDRDEPLMLYPGDGGEGIEAIWQTIIQSRGHGARRTKIFAFFDKAELMDAVPDNGRVELEVVGKLKTGQYYYGSDTVRIIEAHRRSQRRWRR